MDRYFWKFTAAAASIASLLGGCSGARIILPPDGQAPNPIRQFTVQFHANFVPGSFSANLDGKDITSMFSPTPSPGGTSVANWNQPFEVGVSGTFGAEHHLDVNSNTNPNSGFTLQDQRLSADFSAPHLRFYPAGSTALPKNASLSANICLEPTATAAGVYPMTVSLTPGAAAAVNINNAGLSASTSVTLNASTDPVRTCAALSITAGTVPGSWIIEARAVGVQRGVLTGSVL